LIETTSWSFLVAVGETSKARWPGTSGGEPATIVATCTSVPVTRYAVTP